MNKTEEFFNAPQKLQFTDRHFFSFAYSKGLLYSCQVPLGPVTHLAQGVEKGTKHDSSVMLLSHSLYY